MVDELNQQYPEIEHEVMEAQHPLGERGTQPAELNQEAQSRNYCEQLRTESGSVLSFQQ